jgi:hypothetical protein
LRECRSVSVIEHLIKPSRCPKHERHSLIDIGHIRQRVTAESDGATILDTPALAGKGQLDGLSDT